MLATNELKFKDGRVWKAKYIPNPNYPDYPILVFEDVTLELAYTLKEALHLENECGFIQKPDVDLNYFEDKIVLTPTPPHSSKR